MPDATPGRRLDVPAAPGTDDEQQTKPKASPKALLPNWVDIGKAYMLAALTESRTADGIKQTQALCDLLSVIECGGPISLTVSRAMREPGGRISGSTSRPISITARNVFELLAGAASAMSGCLKALRAGGVHLAAPATPNAG